LVFFFVAMLPFPPCRLRQNDGVCLAFLQKTGKGGAAYAGRPVLSSHPPEAIAARGHGKGQQEKRMSKRPFRHWRLTRFVIGRRRLLLSTVIGVLVFVMLPETMRLPTRFIVAWDTTTLFYVCFTLLMIARSTVEICQQRAALYDEGDWVILLLVVASAGASFAAIFAELGKLTSPHGSPMLGIALTGATVALSWTFTHIVFTLHYANVFYKPDEDGPGGLGFPGHRPPDYRDFLYYAFVIGCACQTGDVATISHAMRRLTLMHGIVAFAFNTAILALMINVGASLVH
jgi:uncharacterized membrane protein